MIAQPLEGFPAETWAVQCSAGVDLLVARRVLDRHGPALMPLVELRWYDDSWEFVTADETLVSVVRCRSAGIERIVVPSGSWDCLRLEVGDDQTFWLARGIGIVRWREGRFVRELVSVE